MKNPFTTVVPSTWPNRSIRRALRYGKALPTEWSIFFAANPEMTQVAKAQR